MGRRHLWVASALLLSCGPSAMRAPPSAQPNPAPLVTTDRPTPPSAYPVFWNGTAVSTALTSAEQRVTAIATAVWSTCVLLEDDSVWCWGEGQSVDDRPAQIPLDGVTRLIGAGKRFFAVRKDGSAFYWGIQRLAPDEPYEARVVPRRLATEVLDVAASTSDVCVLDRARKVTCWSEAGASFVTSLAGARSISRSSQSTCALLDSGKVACFTGEQAPVLERGSSDIEQLTAGGDLHCGLRRGGDVHCFPDGPRARAVEKEAGHDVRRLTGSPHAICAHPSKGLPRCVSLPSGSSSDELVAAPTRVFQREAVLDDVNFGADHACGLMGGVAWCWGDNTFEELGDRAAPNGALVRVSLGDTAALNRVAGVTVSAHHRCAVIADHTLRCWGDNHWGQLGTGDQVDRTGPTRVTGFSDIARVASNDTTTCVVLASGALHCFGRLPWDTHLPTCRPGMDDAAPCTATPTLIASGVSRVVLGEAHLCTLGTDSKVRCWGKNEQGQLGTGDREPRVTPTPVRTERGVELAGVTELRAGSFHTCAVTASGHIYCWGENLPLSQGRPYNSATRFTSATPLRGVTDAAEMSGQCIRSRRGELRCWSDEGDRGALTYEPRRVGRCRVEAVATGPGPCFVDPQGLSCWGNDESQGFRAPVPGLSGLSGTSSEICAVDPRGSLLCWSTDYSTVHPSIGRVLAVAAEGSDPDPGCAVDAPLDTLPKFPPVPPASVTVHDLGQWEDDSRLDEDPGVRLSRAQVSNLLALLNDKSNYTSIATCHFTRHLYVFRDSRGERQSSIGVSNDCATLVSDPFIPAQVRLGGNIVEKKLRDGLVRLCNELHLEGCPPLTPESDPE